MDNTKNNISVEVKSDGIYFTLSNPSDDKEELDKAVKDAIFSYGIKEVNFAAVEILMDTKELDTTVKISDDTTLKGKVDEHMSVLFAEKNMEAYIMFKPPKNGGNTLTEEDIMQLILKKGVSYGLDTDLIQEISKKREYEFEYLVAKGLEVKEGASGFLKYYFDTSPKSHKPKLLENGEVDFKELALVKTVEKDQLLVETIPKVEGQEGMTVKGVPILPKKVKEPPNLPKGKNVFVSEDGSQLISSIKGSLSYVNNKIDIAEVLTIKGDVGTHTGNIDFNGSVEVEGSVATGFKIVAEGDVTIGGSVEGAEIISKGNVSVAKTFNGMKKGLIKAQGDIVIGFVKDATLISENNIHSGNIMHSKIKCKGSLYLDGEKGLLVGGDAMVKENIVAKTVGSRMATHTEINIGFDPDFFEEYKENVGKFKEIQKEFNLLQKRLDAIKKHSEIESLPETEQSTALGIVHRQKFLKEQALEIRRVIVKLAKFLNNDKYDNTFEIEHMLYSGVKIQLGNAFRSIADETKGCRVTNQGGIINIEYL